MEKFAENLALPSEDVPPCAGGRGKNVDPGCQAIDTQWNTTAVATVMDRGDDQQAQQADALHMLAYIAYLNHQPDVANDLMLRAATNNPGDPVMYSRYGALLMDMQDYPLAITMFERSIELGQSGAVEPLVYLSLSAACINTRQFQQGAGYATRVLALQPDNARAWHNLGVCMVGLNNLQGAIEHFGRALNCDPLFAPSYANLGATYFKLKNLTAASACSLRAIELDTDNALGYLHLGLVCQEQGNLVGAETLMTQAAMLDRQDQTARWNLALLALGRGMFDQGWRDYNIRWDLQQELGLSLQQFPQPWWQGEPAFDRSILVWWEQGIGDQLMFASMYPDLQQRFSHCVVVCPPKLLPLLQRSFPSIDCIRHDDRERLDAVIGTIDLQSALGSLARWLRPTLESFPRAHRYLSADQNRVDHWRQRLAGLGSGAKIGICWRSANQLGARQPYCSQIEQWAPLFSVGGVQFVNLQYDECSAELARAQQMFDVTVHAFPEINLMDDIDEAAALTSALDLVIAVPTASAVLAAAVGVPTWMLRSGFNWQQFGLTDNSWQASARDFHRGWDRTWEDFLLEIAAELNTWRQSWP